MRALERQIARLRRELRQLTAGETDSRQQAARGGAVKRARAELYQQYSLR